MKRLKTLEYLKQKGNRGKTVKMSGLILTNKKVEQLGSLVNFFWDLSMIEGFKPLGSNRYSEIKFIFKKLNLRKFLSGTVHVWNALIFCLAKLRRVETGFSTNTSIKKGIPTNIKKQKLVIF